MFANNKYLLIGNTRLHWAEIKENKFHFTHTEMNQPFPNNINIDDLIWASVGNYSAIDLPDENEIKTELLNIRNLPNHFGVDRALACFSALKVIQNPTKKNLIIADLGTTLSITKINATGKVIGGQLIPGFLTQLKSMVQNTKNLKFPKKIEIPEGDFLFCTQEAMVKGVYNSLVGAISASFNSKQDLLIFCGGDADFIGNKLKFKIKKLIIEPDLVMKGMILFSQNHLIHQL